MTDPDPPACATVLLDACVLVPIRLATTLLWLAEAGLFEVLWSDTILDEVQRNLPKVGVTEQRAARRVGVMREAFGAGALVDGFDYLIEDMTCDAKDRHVLAAAVHGGADTLVTFNLKDFPPNSTRGHGVEAIHPDLFLTSLLADHPAEVATALERECAGFRKPVQTVRQFLASLTATVPMFAHLAGDATSSAIEPTSPLPALMGTDQSEAVAAFGEPGDFTDPAQVAFTWWAGMLNEIDLARDLTYDPSAWGDYQWALDTLAGKSLASRVIPAVDSPHRIAFMRFVPEVEPPAQVFLPYLTSMTFLTLVKVFDGTWRIWGLGAGMPAATVILGDDEFIPGGGTALVFEWLTRIAEPHPPVALIWGSLDAPLRLANAQSWLLGTDNASKDPTERDAQAAQLSARDSKHPRFDEFYTWLVAHYRHVYREVNGKPCLVGTTETVGVDLELVAFSSEDQVGTYEAGQPFAAHSFITRRVGDDNWVIAANARRMPVPGWPPTEQTLPGLLIDGN